MPGIEVTHAYHLVPGGASKGVAVGAHMRARGYAAEECIAAGDSIEDLGAAEYVGRFFCVANGPAKDEALREAVKGRENVTVTEGRNGRRRLRGGGLDPCRRARMTEWPLSCVELEKHAEARLERSAHSYFRSGAGDELTLARNRAAFDEIALLPRVLVDVSEIDTRTTVLGSEISMPVIVAPTAFHKLADPEGELATARGAAAADTVLCLASLSNTSIEDVAEVAGPRWFQLYVFRDRGLTRNLIERAEASGYGAIVVTVDAPVLGRREADMRNEFALPSDLRIACVDDQVIAPPGESGLAAYFAEMLDPTLDWDDLACTDRQHLPAGRGQGNPPCRRRRARDRGRRGGRRRLEPWRPPARHRPGDDRDAAGDRRSSRGADRDPARRRHPPGYRRRQGARARSRRGDGRPAGPLGAGARKRRRCPPGPEHDPGRAQAGDGAVWGAGPRSGHHRN